MSYVLEKNEKTVLNNNVWNRLKHNDVCVVVKERWIRKEWLKVWTKAFLYCLGYYNCVVTFIPPLSDTLSLFFCSLFFPDRISCFYQPLSPSVSSIWRADEAKLLWVVCLCLCSMVSSLLYSVLYSSHCLCSATTFSDPWQNCLWNSFCNTFMTLKRL